MKLLAAKKTTAELTLDELRRERQFLKEWTFILRYGSIRNLTEHEQQLLDRFKELTEELIKRRDNGAQVG